MERAGLEKYRDRIERMAREYGVKSLRVFGSVARGDADEQSDVDFLVELEPGRSLFNLGGLQMELKKLLNCHVDVVTPKGLRARLRERVLREASARMGSGKNTPTCRGCRS